MKLPRDADRYCYSLLREEIKVIINEHDEYLVVDRDSIDRLWYGGCYGKGSQSRSQPDAGYLSLEHKMARMGTQEQEVLILSPYEMKYLIEKEYVRLVCSPVVDEHKYRVYRHFREIGYVVRHGLQFGCDFLLYQDGPTFSHAFAAVLCQNRTGVFDLTTCMRVQATVKKKLWIVDSNLNIVQLSRWSPQRTRQAGT